jgi:hypothetical protein
MRNDRAVRATLQVALGVMIGTFVAVSAFAQTARQGAPAKKTIEIEVHGGLGMGGNASGGTGALPAAQASFATIDGPTTRKVSSWYFGDGTKLFNDFNTNLGLPANVITPLDPALNASATSRKSGAAFGARVAYPLSDRIAVEGNVDVVLSHLAISDDALSTIAKSSSSFKSTFTLGLTGLPGVSVTSTPTIVDKQGQQLFVTADVRINLLDRGKIMPFVTVGGGMVHGSGTDTVQLVGNYQFLSCGGICPKNETDAVKVAYKGTGNSVVFEFGGGVSSDLSAKAGWRIDARALVSKNVDTTLLGASPVVASASTAVQSALRFGVNPAIQFSTVPGVNSSLSGAPIADFVSFTGGGTRVQFSLTGGYFFRF